MLQTHLQCNYYALDHSTKHFYKFNVTPLSYIRDRKKRMLYYNEQSSEAFPTIYHIKEMLLLICYLLLMDMASSLHLFTRSPTTQLCIYIHIVHILLCIPTSYLILWRVPGLYGYASIYVINLHQNFNWQWLWVLQWHFIYVQYHFNTTIFSFKPHDYCTSLYMRTMIWKRVFTSRVFYSCLHTAKD